MSIFLKGINPGAYQGKLTCPYPNEKGEICGSSALRFVENVTPMRLRYRCRKCGKTLQYDISNNPMANPYAPFRKGKIWRDIMRVTQGRPLKGV